MNLPNQTKLDQTKSQKSQTNPQSKLNKNISKVLEKLARATQLLYRPVLHSQSTQYEIDLESAV